jgi:type I site-specific restriction-modification system R (restriction) subunit
VFHLFREQGYEIRHLDNTHNEQERREILEWFKSKPDAVLTSVSILTTGFDEPSVETIIINRATKSLTLYHQMIGRGSRIFGEKKDFNVIDLGNNAKRFGLWEQHIDWFDIFAHPHNYLESIVSDEQMSREMKYEMSPEIRDMFALSPVIDFDIKEEYLRITRFGGKGKSVLDKSMQQHATIIQENAPTLERAFELLKILDQDIKSRMKQYSYCISKSTESYLDWLKEEYIRKLRLDLGNFYNNLLNQE